MKKLMLFLGLIALLSLTTQLASAQGTNQAACTSIAEKYKNVAHPEDENWTKCFINGWVNWVFGTAGNGSLPDQPPAAVKDALKKGAFVQLTEPWRAGCNNTVKSPHCNIGFLKLFNDWGTLRAFLAKGEITNGITKVGPWTIGSLWVTNNFIQTQGENPSATDKNLFCTGALGWAFAYDGNYPLPNAAPCSGMTNKYILRETWNGGCIGNILPDQNCNVGQIKVYTEWKSLVDFLKNNKWNRGSVWANRDDMLESAGIQIATATPTRAPATSTPTTTSAPSQPTATRTVASAAGITAATATPTTTQPTSQGTTDIGKALMDNLGLFLVLFTILLVLLLLFFGRRGGTGGEARVQELLELVGDERLPDAKAGEAYSLELKANGGKPPYRFIATGLPNNGIRLDPGGTIVGTPEHSQPATTIAVTVKDSEGHEAKKNYLLAVQ